LLDNPMRVVLQDVLVERLGSRIVEWNVSMQGKTKSGNGEECESELFARNGGEIKPMD